MRPWCGIRGSPVPGRELYALLAHLVVRDGALQHTDWYRSATRGRSAEMAVRGGDDLRRPRNVGLLPSLERTCGRDRVRVIISCRKLRNGPQPPEGGDTGADAKRKKRKETTETTSVGSRVSGFNVLPMTPAIMHHLGGRWHPSHPSFEDNRVQGHALSLLTSGPWRPGGVDQNPVARSFVGE